MRAPLLLYSLLKKPKFFGGFKNKQYLCTIKLLLKLNYKTMDELQNIQNLIYVIRGQRVALVSIPTWNVKSSVKIYNNHLIICKIRKVLLSLQRHFF